MKTVTISNILKSNLLIMELPEGYTVNTYADKISICNEINNPIHFFKGSYTLLGSPDEISEEDAKELVEYDFREMTDECFFRQYNSKWEDNFDACTAKESLLSAIESEIYWNVNPLGDEPNHLDYKFEKYKGEFHFKSESHKSRYGNAYEKWQDAELQTFDRTRTLIFKKNEKA